MIDRLNSAIEGLKTYNAEKFAKVIAKATESAKALDSYNIK